MNDVNNYKKCNAISFKLYKENEFVLFCDIEPHENDLNIPFPNNYDLKCGNGNLNQNIHLNCDGDYFIFQLKENKTYYLRAYKGLPSSPLSEDIKNKKNINYKVIITDQLISFNVQGFLGSSYFECNNVRINFEIIPDKIDYETDYKKMTDDINAKISQLLLNDSAPVSLHFGEGEEYKKSLLEQFIIIKHFINEGNVFGYIQSIKFNPHQKLKKDAEWMPSHLATFDNYFKNPVKYSRDCSSKNKIPNEIYSIRKYVSFDTAPNQFIKFVLNDFYNVCLTIKEIYSEPKINSGILFSEVEKVLETIGHLLMDPFFKEISTLKRIPFDNQTLQKRFGYKEILNIWLISQLALKVKWEGRENSFSASTRNVAELYEYWLYFKILEILEAEPINLKPIEIDSKNAVIRYTDKGMLINLSEGKESLMAFNFYNGQLNLRIHFYYNRTFSKRKIYNSESSLNEVNGINSYSAPFRPDYSLVIFPNEYSNESTIESMENTASNNGRIAYLHFDAKYRVDKIKKAWGTEVDNEGNFLNNEELSSKVTDTFKRGDLYKMHTYNDAIKRTIGSYVLYPGDNNEDKIGDKYRAYHEILPGVGAFALKPGIDTSDISNFIKDCLLIQASKFSQLYKMQHKIHEIVKEEPFDFKKYSVNELIKKQNTPPSEIIIALGYQKKNDLGDITNSSNFYFHAIKQNNRVKKFPHEIYQAKQLFIYTGSRNGQKKFAGYYAEIESIELMHKSLIKGKEKSSTEFYFSVKLNNTFQRIEELNEKPLVSTILFDKNDKENALRINSFLPAITTMDKIFL
jgi:predicted component of viral defense system (DUF524 family)